MTLSLAFWLNFTLANTKDIISKITQNGGMRNKYLLPLSLRMLPSKFSLSSPPFNL